MENTKPSIYLLPTVAAFFPPLSFSLTLSLTPVYSLFVFCFSGFFSFKFLLSPHLSLSISKYSIFSPYLFSFTLLPLPQPPTYQNQSQMTIEICQYVSHTHTHTHKHTYTQTHIYTHTYTQTHIYTHTYRMTRDHLNAISSACCTNRSRFLKLRHKNGEESGGDIYDNNHRPIPLGAASIFFLLYLLSYYYFIFFFTFFWFLFLFFSVLCV